MNMTQLEAQIRRGHNINAKYFAIVVDMGGFPTPEVIINNYANMEDKLSYYKKAYNKNLIHNHSSDIKISDCACGKNFEEIAVLLGLDEIGV